MTRLAIFRHIRDRGAAECLWAAAEAIEIAAIHDMDGDKASAFWAKWKARIFQTIEMSPAEPANAPPVAS